ncbi:MAG: histidine phosphatase family protein [Elusimicrobia bacterium]|nr:histidine phosphatase family protein [Elusimicrobiota bacterium]
MKLYLLRHGHSPSLQEAGVTTDADRPLSAAGREAIRRAARFLRDQGAHPQVILTSPLRRAQESAEEAARTLTPPQGVQPWVLLENRVSGKELWKPLQSRAAGLAELLVVGHQPQLGELLLSLSGKDIAIAPGGLVALAVNPEKSSLLWVQAP